MRKGPKMPRKHIPKLKISTPRRFVKPPKPSLAQKSHKSGPKPAQSSHQKATPKPSPQAKPKPHTKKYTGLKAKPKGKTRKIPTKKFNPYFWGKREA
jgi:hypothetical protein